MAWNTNYDFQNFVEEIGEMIQHDINMIDRNGIIIASTNKSRIGEVHEASINIIENGLDKLVINADSGFKGTRPGINLPVIFRGEVVGVVGITGDPEKVIAYGEIIRKVTQMMVQEEYEKERERITHSIYNSFILEWLTQTPRDRVDFASRAKLLGIELERNRRCAIFQLSNAGLGENFGERLIEASDALIAAVQAEIKGRPHGVYLNQESRCIVLLPGGGTNVKECRSFCERVKAVVEERSSIPLAVGIGSAGMRIEDVQRSFREADQAVTISLRDVKCGIRLYEEMDVEILLQSLSRKDKETFVHRVMGGVPQERLPRYMEMLSEMYQLNGSLTQVAARMFIHKNTLQQWILKIRDYTGYDPRTIRDGIPLYLAMMFYREMEAERSALRP